MKRKSTLSIFQFAFLFVPILFVACRSSENDSQRTPAKTQASVEPESTAEDTAPPIAIADVTELRKLQDSVIARAKIALPGAMTELPDWLKPNDLPFDTDQYFQIDRERNGNAHYVRAAAISNLRDAIFHLPELLRRYEDDELSPALKRLETLNKLFGDSRYELSAHVRDPDDPGHARYFQTNAAIYAERVRPIIAELNKAHQLQTVVLDRDFSLDSLFPYFGVAAIAQDLSILGKIAPHTDEAIDAMSLSMQVERNLRKLGCSTSQLRAGLIFRETIFYQVEPILKAVNDPVQLGRIIAVLHEAHRSEIEMPRFVEAAKNEHIQLRKLLHELRTDTLKFDPSNSEYLGTEEVPAILKAHKMMTLDFMGGYVTNEDIAIKELKKATSEKPELVEQAKQLIKESRESPLTRDAAAGMIVPAVHASFNSMTADDFDKEIALLKRRYAEIKECSRMPFPDRIGAVAVLQKQWIKDDKWKESKFLKWYRPQRTFGKTFIKARLLSDGFLCLACVKKYQMENAGRMPNDLNQALKAAGIENPQHVIDPYSGDAFKIQKNDSDELILYSVGPDGKDDLGKKTLSVTDYQPGDKGDILISLE